LKEEIRVKGILKFLAAAKLVDLSEEERITLEVAAFEQNPNTKDDSIVELPLPEEVPPVIEFEHSALSEGKSFEDIFASAQIANSPFPAERLLRLLDGLRAMDEATRKAAVRAMDAADDNWTIDDSVIDAQRKINALEAYQKALESQLASKQQQVSAEIADMKLAEEQAITEIRKQISELERLLEREIQKTAEYISGLEGSRQAALEACEREVKRLHVEIERLREIPKHFSS
jgi:hypothetical protein